MRRRHDDIVRAELARYRGREIKTMGDGFLATFEGPARGVHCARAIADRVRGVGIEIRAGLHTGEIELDGDDVAGIAVSIGARIGAMAGPSEVLVSRTVKDLTAGSGLSFTDAGEHELKVSTIAGVCSVDQRGRRLRPRHARDGAWSGGSDQRFNETLGLLAEGPVIRIDLDDIRAHRGRHHPLGLQWNQCVGGGQDIGAAAGGPQFTAPLLGERGDALRTLRPPR